MSNHRALLIKQNVCSRLHRNTRYHGIIGLVIWHMFQEGESDLDETCIGRWISFGWSDTITFRVQMLIDWTRKHSTSTLKSGNNQLHSSVYLNRCQLLPSIYKGWDIANTTNIDSMMKQCKATMSTYEFEELKYPNVWYKLEQHCVQSYHLLIRNNSKANNHEGKHLNHQFNNHVCMAHARAVQYWGRLLAAQCGTRLRMQTSESAQ